VPPRTCDDPSVAHDCSRGWRNTMTLLHGDGYPAARSASGSSRFVISAIGGRSRWVRRTSTPFVQGDHGWARCPEVAVTGLHERIHNRAASAPTSDSSRTDSGAGRAGCPNGTACDASRAERSSRSFESDEGGRHDVWWRGFSKSYGTVGTVSQLRVRGDQRR